MRSSPASNRGAIETSDLSIEGLFDESPVPIAIAIPMAIAIPLAIVLPLAEGPCQ
jgi:hypothetical protein